MTQDQRSFL